MNLKDVSYTRVRFNQENQGLPSQYLSIIYVYVCFICCQVFDDGQCVHLVQDLLRGEELLDRVLRLPDFTERDASAIICTLTKTVEYLHSQGVRWTTQLQPHNSF